VRVVPSSSYGWTMDHELWDRQVTAFAPSYRCVTVDLRGHGSSSKPVDGYGYEEHVEDLHELLGALDLRHATLVGSSMGGAIAIQLAAVHPERVVQVVTVGTPHSSSPMINGLRVAPSRWSERFSSCSAWRASGLCAGSWRTPRVPSSARR
jgi:pimeloyl-ACP methyl ester carboxylesterase